MKLSMRLTTERPPVEEPEEPEVTPERLRRYDRPVPRYTSYPTADRFLESFDEADYRAALARADADEAAPLSLYVHLPFCRKMCTYCGCTLVVSNSPTKKADYLEHLFLEIDRTVEHLPHRREVREIHLGGGTPTSYPPEDLERLLMRLRERFDVTPDAEISIEVDPRHADAELIRALRSIGFTRLSAGVQDFDPDVQRAVGRIQPFEQTKAVMDAAHETAFESVNIDLIYGLPLQTVESFTRTIEQALALSPDRIALYSFAYVPHARPNQRRIEASTLPSADGKLELFCLARRAFLAAGYVAIGMDHFARPDDALALAQQSGTLGRSFQGYTVVRGADTIGFGMSAIGDVGGAYVQSEKRLPQWSAALEEGRLPTARGVRLSPDDEVRRFIIRELMCNLRLEESDLLSRFGKRLSDFPHELARLEEPAREGLVEVDPDALRVTPKGRLFVRTVASCFDRYLHEASGAVPYSRAI